MYSGAKNICRRVSICVLLMGVFIMSAVFIATPAKAVAGINQQLNFQGRLFNTQGATVPDGYYNIQFKIYQDGDGQSVATTGSPLGSPDWTENHLNANSQGVMVKNGFMSVELGSITAFGSNIDWNQSVLWLSVNIGSTNASCTPFSSCTPDGEMIPMKRMSSNPYSLNSGLLGGLASTDFLQIAKGVQTDTSTNTNSIYINKTGTGNLITLQSSGSDAFTVTNSGDISFGANSNHTLSVTTATANVAGKSLTLTGGAAGTGAASLAGGDIVLQGGAGGGTNSAGGNVSIDSGAKTGSGSDGSIYIGSNRATSVQIGSTTLATTQTINIGTNNTAGSTTNVTIGSGSSANAGTTTVRSKGNMNLTSSGGTMDITSSGNSSISSTAGTISVSSSGNAGMTSTAGTLALSGNGDTSLTSTAGTIALNSSGYTTISTGGVVRSTFAANNLYLGNGLTAASPNSFTISGTGSTTTAVAGGDITIQGGAATVGNANGGSLTLTGGTGIGTGTKGLVNIGATAYTTATNAVCSADCTITQSYVDNYGTVIISASVANIVITLPPPTDTATAGRVLSVTSQSGSQDFTITTNSGGNVINVAMRQNTTASMVWNGSAWTAGGASNATTLQAAYNNGTNPSTTPEIKLDATRGGIDIQDADISIGSDIFDIHASNASALGTVLFGVSSAGRVTIQGTTDQYSAFRVLRSNGDYLFNINSSNGYVFSNSVSSPGNGITNPSFETGGSINGGEEGWFGPAQATIVNDAGNANTGNYEMQVIPNTTNLDIYAGTYYEVAPGDNLYFEGYVKNSAGANGNAGAQITWYDKDKSVVSYSTNYAGLPGTSYVLRKINGTAPNGANYARVSATVRSTSSTGTFYFDNFYLKRSSETADYAFRNSQDSTSAFRIQSAGSAQTLFTADTTNNILKVGDSTGSDTATTLLVLDSATVDPTTNLASKNGALFYRSDNNNLKAIIGGAVVDVCTTAVTCTGYSASAGSTVQLQGTSPGTAQDGNFNITGIGILTQLQTQDQSSPSTNSDNLVIRTGNATGSSSNSGNLTLDVGTATGTKGTITIGHTGISSTIVGTLAIQGSNTLTLGKASVATGSILFNTSAGANHITIAAPGSNPTSSYTLTLPQVLGIAGDCLKDTGSGSLGFSNCTAGTTVTLQNAYDNSSPANTTLADNKDYTITAQQTTTSPSIVFDLQCTTNCTSKGYFAVQNGGVNVFTVQPNGGGITLANNVQIGSSTTDTTQVNLQLDSASNTTDTGACTNAVNQGAMYYNTSMGSIRACVNGSWGDISNPDTLGLLTFGIVPSSGSNPYDLPALIIPGVSGPCKVSWSSTVTVHVESCVAYSNGRRINVAATTLYTNNATAPYINLTTAARWGHICLTGTNGQAAFTTTSGQTLPTSGMPDPNVNFNAAAPTLCLADVVGSSSSGSQIDDIYDVRTFTTSLKEAVNVSTPVELGMVVDAGTNGAMAPAVSSSNKLYGLVVATNGLTSAGAPNAIINTVGPGWAKAIAGTAGQFVKTSTTNGYSNTVVYIPNNSFYYSIGNTRTSYSTVCNAANNCGGSLYVNLIVR